jgi:hypothetical protein
MAAADHATHIDGERQIDRDRNARVGNTAVVACPDAADLAANIEASPIVDHGRRRIVDRCLDRHVGGEGKSGEPNDRCRNRENFT